MLFKKPNTITVTVLVFFLTGLALTTLVMADKQTAVDTPKQSTQGPAKALLKVQGMTCGGCVSTIQSSLADFDGIDDIQVNLAAGTTEVIFDPQKLDDPGKLAQAISASGYPAQVVKVVATGELRKANQMAATKSRTTIATVGSIDISRTDFEAEMAHVRSRYESVYGASAFNSPKGLQLLNNLKRQIAAGLITQGIQLQEILKAGFKIDQVTVDRYYAAYLEKRALSKEAFEAQLEKSGYALDYFMEKFEKRTLINAYIDEKVFVGSVSDTEKQRLFRDWFANAQVLAPVVYYDKEIERLLNSNKRGGGCGSTCSTKS